MATERYNYPAHLSPATHWISIQATCLSEQCLVHWQRISVCLEVKSGQKHRSKAPWSPTKSPTGSQYMHRQHACSILLSSHQPRSMLLQGRWWTEHLLPDQMSPLYVSAFALLFFSSSSLHWGGPSVTFTALLISRSLTHSQSSLSAAAANAGLWPWWLCET